MSHLNPVHTATFHLSNIHLHHNCYEQTCPTQIYISVYEISYQLLMSYIVRTKNQRKTEAFCVIS
jgi:hypothetical protein